MKKKRFRPEYLSTNRILLRVFKYALKSKALLFLSIFCLIIFSILEIIQPLIIKKVIDDELSGVTTVWVETDKSTKTIEFDGKYYQKDDGEVLGERYTIRFHDETYVLIDEVLAHKDKIVSADFENQILNVERTLEDESVISFSANFQILSKDDLLHFYQASINPIIMMIILYAIVSITILITRYIQTVTFTQASMKLTLDMRKHAFNKLNKLPIAYFTHEPNGKTVTKIIYDSEGVRGLYQVVFSIFSAFISLVMIYVGLFYLDYRLALYTFLAFPIIYIWMTVYRRAVNAFNQSIREMNSKINGKLAEFVNGAKIIQLFNKEQKMTNEYDSMLKENYQTKMKHLKINTLFGFDMLNLIRRLLVGAILIYFSYQYFSITTVVMATTIYVYIEYLEKIIHPISEIFSNLNSFEDSLVSASRIFQFLDESEDVSLGKAEDIKFKGNVEFRNVSFKYDEKYVLNNVSFNVLPGQFIGLVGKTGSGKTTLMSLLERFYDVEEGKILIDDVNYHQYTKQTVRNNIGIILQDPSIFEGTIKSNVTFGLEVEDERVEEILDTIGAGKFVRGYKDGIHTKVAYMGENLSTGEKQLIAFARILLRNPSIMILDEATANIDTETEMLIQNALTVLSKSRTTFVVAHRLSTIKNADMIYVLDQGQVIEKGNHHELYQKENGVYKAMYDALG